MKQKSESTCGKYWSYAAGAAIDTLFEIEDIDINLQEAGK